MAEFDEVRRRIVACDNAVAVFALGLALSAISLAASLLALEVQRPDEVVPAIAACGLTFIGCGLALRGKLRRVRALVDDFYRGRATVFRGVPDGIVRFALRKAGAIGNPSDVRDIAVLPRSAQAVSADGVVFRILAAAPLAEPGDSDPIPEDSARGIGRPLSTAEADEVRGTFGRRIWAFAPLAATLLGSTVLALRVAQERYPERYQLGLTGALIAVVVTGALATANWSRTARLWRDIRRGRVILMADAALSDVIDGGSPYSDMNVEVLPLSERVWTIEGHPAGWRTKGRRATVRAR